MNWIKRTIINHIYVYTQPYRRHTSFRDVLWLIGPRFLYCHAWFSEPVPLINAQRGVAGFTMSRDKEYGMIWKEQIRIQKHVELKSMHYIIFNCLLVIINHYESLLIIIGHLISLLSHYLLYKSQLWNQILHDIPIWLMSHEKYLCPRPSCWLVELPITD